MTIGNDEVVTESDFIYDVDAWLIGLSTESRTMDMAGQILSKTRTYYDGNDFAGLPLGQVTRGLVTRSSVMTRTSPFVEGGQGDFSTEERWIDTSRMAYNDDGLVVATKDANGNMVELEYDAATRSLPVTERFFVDVGPLEFTAEYDEGYGSIQAATDLNGYTSRFYYDGLGRLTDIVDPLGTVERPMTHYDYEYGTPEYPVSMTTVKSLIDRDTGLYQTSWQFSDGMGRGRLTKTEAEGEHGYIGSGWVDTSARGSAYKVYDSFASQSNGFEAAPSDSPVTVSYFDALGRADMVYPPATPEYGQTYTKTMYKPFETWVYDERDTFEGTWQYPAVTKVDGQGRVTEILKHNDVNGAFTALQWFVEYNTLGSITAFIDPKGNRRTYGYDDLQRMIHVSDPNAGEIGYQYDDVGNLVKRIDSLGQVQTFTYGMANRLLQAVMKNDAHGRDDYSYTYHYDTAMSQYPTAQNLLGKLSSVEWPTGTHAVSYDELGRLEKEVQTLWNGTSPYGMQNRDKFEQTYAYNAGGQLLSQVAPGGLALNFDYNARSLLSQVSGGFAGDQSPIFSGIRYDHRGATVKTDARNNTSTYAFYDNRARLAAMVSGKTDEMPFYHSGIDYTKPLTGAFQQLQYHRTPTGLLKSIDDHSPMVMGVPRFDASYGYDRLYQLTEANTADGQITYAYDTIQNLVRRNTEKQLAGLVQGEFKYGERGYGPNQITSTPEQKFDYNAIGQMKRYNGFDLYFDVEGRLVGADKPGGTNIKYYYDDTGAKKLAIMKKPSEPQKIYRYVFGNYQIRNGKQTWFLVGGQGQAEITESDGLEVDLYLLNELNDYVVRATGGSPPDESTSIDNQKKPLPAEFMDLDGDGNYDFDEEDLAIAREAFWNETPINGSCNTNDTSVGATGGSPSTCSSNGKPLVWRYYHKDHLGGNTVVTDSMGDVVSAQRYHPYGQTAERTGQKPIYGFAGGEIEEEEELGLVQFGARWYAVEIGRWVSADPLFLARAPKNMVSPLQSNMYSYSKNNPTNYVDPSGLIISDSTESDTDDEIDYEITQEEIDEWEANQKQGQPSSNGHAQSSATLEFGTVELNGGVSLSVLGNQFNFGINYSVDKEGNLAVKPYVAHAADAEILAASQGGSLGVTNCPSAHASATADTVAGGLSAEWPGSENGAGVTVTQYYTKDATVCEGVALSVSRDLNVVPEPTGDAGYGADLGLPPWLKSPLPVDPLASNGTEWAPEPFEVNVPQLLEEAQGVAIKYEQLLFGEGEEQAKAARELAPLWDEVAEGYYDIASELGFE